MKKPRTYLAKNESTNQNRTQGGRQRHQKRQRRYTVSSAAEIRTARRPVGRDPGEVRREALKEQFQRDIEDTIAGGCEPDPVAVQLQFECECGPTLIDDESFSRGTTNVEEPSISELIAEAGCGNGLQLGSQWNDYCPLGTPTDAQKASLIKHDKTIRSC